MRSESIKKILGALLLIVGIILGLYVGVWLMFIGGILGLAEVVNQVNAGFDLDGLLIATSVLKIAFAGFVGWIIAVVTILPGLSIIGKSL